MWAVVFQIVSYRCCLQINPVLATDLVSVADIMTWLWCVARRCTGFSFV